MNKLALFIPFLLCAACAESLAQNDGLRIGFQTGYNSYELNGLEEFNQSILRNSTVGQFASPVQQFPSHMNIGFSASFAFKRAVIGLEYNLLSTGSRYHYKDYSGEAGLDTILKGHSIALTGKLKFNSANNSKLRAYAGFKPNVIFGTYDIEEYIRLENSETSSDLELDTRALGAGLFLSVEHDIRFFTLFVDAGFDITLTSGLYYNDKQVYTDGTTQTNVSWSGLRTSIGILLHLDN